MTRLLGALLSDPGAARVVPPAGFTAHLTLFTTAVMGFLAVFVLALSLAAGRLAASWSNELAGSVTVRIMAPQADLPALTDVALAVLETTAGVISARALGTDEQQALLAPWLGTDIPVEDLPLPRMIDADVDPDRFDAAGLRLRLAGEVPAAILDDHGRWRRPLGQAAGRLRVLGGLAAILILGAIAAMVTLAAHAALAANAQVISVLRLVGASDGYIAGAFVRRFTRRAVLGAACGAAAGVIALVLMPVGEAGAGGTGLLTGLRFQGASWLVPAVVPIFAGFVAWLATTAAARQTLGRLR